MGLGSLSAEAIKTSYQNMHKIFHRNNIVDLTQPHFSNCYIQETKIL